MFAWAPFSAPETVRVRVIIPAQGEVGSIEQALDALRAQVDPRGNPLPPNSFDVTVLAGADGSADAVRDYAGRYVPFPLRVLDETVPSSNMTVGTARRTLMDDACARFEAEGRVGTVASTDADTTVAPDWIAATLVEFAKGADVVGGRIVLAAATLASLSPELRRLHLQDTDYRLMLAELGARIDPRRRDPLPCHHQHFCPSLAVRSDVYRRAAECSNLVTPDDMAFHDALESIDAQIRHSPLVRVTTSACLRGQMPAGPSPLVESVPRSLKRLQLRRELRNRWRYRQEHRQLERGTRMDSFAFFGAYLAAIRAEMERYLDETVGAQPVPLDHAIAELRTTLASHH